MMELQPPHMLGRQGRNHQWRRGITSGTITAGSSGTVQLLDGDSDALASEPREITAKNDSSIEIPDATLVHVSDPPVGGTSFYIYFADICGA